MAGADGSNNHSYIIIFSLLSKEADLKKKVMWVGVKIHVAGDEKIMSVRSDFHLHLTEGEKIG
ncbi:hypothetical protein [Enterococcus faecalis]|uniref:hypothetical protein n=1 Tax=Enterococcus faecalis TaxID=1351 RepID=UPI0012AECD5E|nr:hypothetical protein [Enterococcus faecalis]